MRNLQLLFALFLVPFMVQGQSNLFIKYDSACMDRYEYQLGENPNVKSFVTYSIKVNRNEKVVLEVGIESIKMQSKLPKGARLKTCENLKLNQRLVNRINNKQVKVYMVRQIGGKYNLSTVSIASLYREAKGELTFIGNNYNFSFNPNKHFTGDNLSGKNSDSDVFYHGKEPYQCTEAIKFQRSPIEICCCSFTDLIYVPKIGIVMEQGGNPSEGTKENALNLRAIDGVPFGQYMATICAPPTKPQPAEEVIVAREPVVYDVIQEKVTPPPPPAVSYGLLIEQKPEVKTVSFVPYELMVAEVQPEIKTVGYGLITEQEQEVAPAPYEIVTTMTAKGAIPKPCNGENRAGTHIVQPGESLYGIARMYGANVKNIQNWNSLQKEEIIHPCTQLYVVPPPKTNTVTETYTTRNVVPVSYEVVQERTVRCSEQSSSGYHVMQAKETINDIARLYGLNAKNIQNWNNITDINNIPVCTRLRLVAPVPTTYEVITERIVPQSRCPEQSTSGTHIVQPKENLSQIAALYGLNAKDIQNWNGITDVLNIPICTRLRLVPQVPTSYEVFTERIVPQSRCLEQSTSSTHIVQAKENLSQIAALYGLNVKDLKKWNGITDVRNVQICTRLRLVPQVPTSYEVVTERIAPQSRCLEQSTPGTHIVQPKENLSQIATLYGLSVNNIKKWNGITDVRNISICSRLRLVPQVPTSYEVITERVTPASRCVEVSTPGTHIVQPKENLNQIAALYDLNIQDLRRWNGITDVHNIPVCTPLRLVPLVPASYEVVTERVVSTSKCPQSSMPGMHIVQPKETLSQVAALHNLSIEQLRAWNNISNQNVISVCSELRLVPPAPTAYEIVTERIVKSPTPAPAKRCAEKSTSGTHIVQPKETLNQISALYGLNMQDLRKWNQLKSVNNIPACTRLRLTAPAPTSYDFTEKRVTTCKEKSSKGQHVVQSGETLYSISKKYKVSITDLQAWNGFGNTTYLAPCMKIYTRRPASYGQTPKARINVAPTQTRIIERQTVVVPSVPMDCNAKSSDGIHIVRKGESLYSLSKKYKVSIAYLQNLNGLGTSEHIAPCMKLITKATKPTTIKTYETVTKRLVPAPQPVAPPVARPRTQTKSAVTETLSTRTITYDTHIKCPEVTSLDSNVHVVKFEETLSSISNRYGVSVAQLRAWNNIGEGDILSVCTPLSVVPPASYKVNSTRITRPEMTEKSGTIQTIVVPPSQQPSSFNKTTTRINVPSTQLSSDGRRIHEVRSGETIESIARTYQIAPERLRSANLMDEKELITPGQKLYLK